MTSYDTDECDNGQRGMRSTHIENNEEDRTKK